MNGTLESDIGEIIGPDGKPQDHRSAYSYASVDDMLEQAGLSRTNRTPVQSVDDQCEAWSRIAHIDEANGNHWRQVLDGTR